MNNLKELNRVNELLGTNFEIEIDWEYISEFQKLSEDFIREFKDKIDWGRISGYQKLSEDFIREFKNEVYWNYISQSQKLSEDFIREFKGKVYWNLVSIRQKLSEDFIREFRDKVDWSYISKHQKLSEDFIREFKNKVDGRHIFVYQKLSDDFIQEFNLTVEPWLYYTVEQKRAAIEKCGLYELDGDNIIAYKGVRSDGYSKFNFQYHYEVGEEYEAHCDCTEEENSFGLSAWTLEGAIKYCDEKIFKVSIPLEKLGRIVHDGGKLRCFGFKILDEVFVNNFYF